MIYLFYTYDFFPYFFLFTWSAGGSGQSDAMRDFFSDVELVKKHIVGIKQASKRIADISQQVYWNHIRRFGSRPFLNCLLFSHILGRADNLCR
jgi:hypothetical protein